METRGAICVFAKRPEPGRAKTRLAASIGVEPSAALAAAFLRDTLFLMHQMPWGEVILAAETSMPDFDAEKVWLQGEGDLGQRMERVLSRALQTHPFAIAVGTDSPGLPMRLLQQAREALQNNQAVLGPADDGGFYLLGLSVCPPGLLANLAWSMPETFEQTHERLVKKGLRVATLESWFDVDELKDLLRLRRMLEQGQAVAPTTARVLQSMPSLPTKP